MRTLGQQQLEDEEQQVGLHVALVHLVDHDVRARHRRVARAEHAQQHARGAEEEAGVWTAARLQPDVVTDRRAARTRRALAALGGDALGDGDGGDPARLRADDRARRPAA